MSTVNGQDAYTASTACAVILVMSVIIAASLATAAMGESRVCERKQCPAGAAPEYLAEGCVCLTQISAAYH